MYSDTKVKNYKEHYDTIIKKFKMFASYERISLPEKFTFKPNKNLVRSNISKKRFKSLVKEQKNILPKEISSRWLLVKDLLEKF